MNDNQQSAEYIILKPVMDALFKAGIEAFELALKTNYKQGVEIINAVPVMMETITNLSLKSK